MKQIAVFASGTGSNFEAIVSATKTEKLTANVALLVCDNPAAQVITKAKKAGINTFVFNPKTYKNKHTYEHVILDTLLSNQIDLVVLAGYMRLIGPTLLTPFKHKIINIHPSLLPAFKGLDAVGQAIKAGVKVTGVTVHYVDEGMDTGDIIAQVACPITLPYHRDKIETAIHHIEHQLYPKTIQKILEEQ